MNILTTKEVSKLLKLHYRTVITLSNNKTLPAFKIGGSWRYNEEEILNLVSTKKVTDDRL